ncbi:Probable diguanylate cyclase YdaM [Pannonibacter phragmitetus]|uniref:diguanylate cyclase n=2 Tax=Pannonibacter phragmitetus TaxID=121719 RepID=A0A379HJS2_9HYPH|nr:Probable diguanylate cyclase YdaM [Pannonibacter phragmitetus]
MPVMEQFLSSPTYADPDSLEGQMTMQDADRQKVLDGYQILDSGYEAGFDRITELARTVFEAPVAVICFIDKDRQWFKSHPGFDKRETQLEHAICRFTVLSDKALLIPDALADERTRDNPYVTGPDQWRAYAGAPLIAPGGVRIGTVSIFDRKPRDFTPRDEDILQQLAAIVMHNLELRRVADNDWLTGVPGRGAFERRSRALLSAGSGSGSGDGSADGHRNALIVFDLDFFKQLNDTYGHAAGDEVLKEVSRTCQAALRENDAFSRIGGEEFSVLLPATAPDVAGKVARRLQQCIAAMPRDRLSKYLPDTTSITASFGVTMVTDGEFSIKHALRRADAALYAAKERGRNCVVCSWDLATAEQSYRKSL